MTASIVTDLMAKALRAELLARGYVPPPLPECEEIAHIMVEKTAEAAKLVRERSSS